MRTGITEHVSFNAVAGCLQNPLSCREEVQASLMPLHELRQTQAIVNTDLSKEKRNQNTYGLWHLNGDNCACKYQKAIFQNVNFSENFDNCEKFTLHLSARSKNFKRDNQMRLH